MRLLRFTLASAACLCMGSSQPYSAHSPTHLSLLPSSLSSELRKNHGKEEARARDLFYALWIPDLFMQRVEVRRRCPCFGGGGAGRGPCGGGARCWREGLLHLSIKGAQCRSCAERLLACLHAGRRVVGAEVHPSSLSLLMHMSPTPQHSHCPTQLPPPLDPCRPTPTGPSSAPTRPPAWPTAGARSLRRSTPNTSGRAGAASWGWWEEGSSAGGRHICGGRRLTGRLMGPGSRRASKGKRGFVLRNS